MNFQILRSLYLGRVVPEVEPRVAKMIADKEINLKKVPTRRNMGFVQMPTQLELAAQAKIRRIADSSFRKEAKHLISVMHNLKLPDDAYVLRLKKNDIKLELELRDRIKERADYEPNVMHLKEDKDIAQYELSKLIEGTLEERRRDWHYYEYDDRSASLYMATRLAPNYACLATVLREIRDFDPTFEPKSVLDFGSGMGTSIWAVNETWNNSVTEFMNIDLSKDQQNLCEYLLRGGKDTGDNTSNVIHRQYLPSSDRAKYDLVVAAFSLLELPNMDLRVQTIESLWSKTNDMLVLVERGNNGGFSTINEARNLVLDLSGHNTSRRISMSPSTKLDNKFRPPAAHVVGPCSHELVCPRLQMPSKKRINICRFRVFFEPLDLGEKKHGFLPEEFSYIVLRRGPHPSYFDQATSRWPRAVEKRKFSSQQITHKICCSSGHIAEITFTKKKYGKEAYEIAKSCDWGDILPIKAKDIFKKKSSFIDEKTQGTDSQDDSKRREINID